MRIFDSLKRVAALLEPHTGSWAVCGGIAACLYRDIPRFTADIDIAFCTHTEEEAAVAARRLLSELGYRPVGGDVVDQYGKLLPGDALIIGREERDERFIGIDFLLPLLPWVEGAVARAQENRLDYGFAWMPTITPEDLIIAKLYACNGNPSRKQDLDDIQSILLNLPDLDSAFLKEHFKLLDLSLPPGLLWDKGNG